MQSKIYGSFADALSDVQDGSSVLLAGFGPGTPHNLIDALHKQGAKDLTLIANALGGGSGLQRNDRYATVANLIEDGRVSGVVASFTAATHASQHSPLEELVTKGLVTTEIVPQGTLAERIRAGGSGIPAFYTPAGVGTEIANGKEQRDFNGRTYLMEEAITADYAFIRAWKADEFGNLRFRRAQRNFNPLMAQAGDCTIVEVEEVVPVGSLDPDHIHTPGIWVQRIVQIPPEDQGGIWHPLRTV
jgi:3-oxoacid CoA-transferase A subunit